MRIVSWNLGHQTRRRAIKVGFTEVISSLQPDVLLLNEYVHEDELRASMLLDLREMGLSYWKVSDQVNRPSNIPGGSGPNNQVFAAARVCIRLGELRGPTTLDNGGITNFLHVKPEGVPFEIVGIRVPDYRGVQLESYWDAFETLAEGVSDRRIIFIGDFNDDPEQTQSVGGGALASLRSAGWQLPVADGSWSFKSGTRIDHVLASNSMPKLSARYVTRDREIVLAGTQPDAISDHAALVVDIGIAAEAS